MMIECFVGFDYLNLIYCCKFEDMLSERFHFWYLFLQMDELRHPMISFSCVFSGIYSNNVHVPFSVSWDQHSIVSFIDRNLNVVTINLGVLLLPSFVLRFCDVFFVTFV